MFKNFFPNLKEFNPIIYGIKKESDRLQFLSDDDLINHIKKLSKIIEQIPSDKLDNELHLTPWFSIVQEVSKRTLGLKHYDTQLLAGIYLNKGCIVEMKTGEGKTLVSTLPVSLNALNKKGAHVITVNDYLSERDKKWMGKIYTNLGLSVGLVTNFQNEQEKKDNYLKDITYITNSEIVFDYLRENSAFDLTELTQPRLQYCLIDEIDSILIDEARTPLILSNSISETPNNILKFYVCKETIKFLQKDIHFTIDKKIRDISLTDEGYYLIQNLIKRKTLYNNNNPWMLDILNALKAKYIYKLNKDYVILNNQIVIVDEFTGRLMPDRRFGLKLHEALEVKENLNLGLLSITQSSITYQSFFPLYSKLSGMTGTALSDEKEFNEIYKLNVIPIAPAKELIRKDLKDVVYLNELAKWKGVLNKAIECYKKGQPILIGTSSIEKSEFLSDLFSFANLPHKVLNAKPENVEKESEIIGEAGKPFAITIATNMAGRGTDIILGGNPIFTTKEYIKKEIFSFLNQNKNSKYFNLIEKLLEEYYQIDETLKILKIDIETLPYSLDTSAIPSLKLLYNEIYKEIYEIWIEKNNYVKKNGGLFVLGTERYETRRIDNQLRGRAGRQGDPGISQFYLSLEDDLLKNFGGEKIKNMINFLLDDENEPLESSILTNSIAKAQSNIESYYFDIRKNVIQYEVLVSFQRQFFYECRKFLLKRNDYYSLFLRLSESFIYQFFMLSKEQKNIIKKQKSEIFETILIPNFILTSLKKKKKLNTIIAYQNLWAFSDFRLSNIDNYQENMLENIYSLVFLQNSDFFWTNHIDRTNYIKDTINWISFGQQNPIDEYNLKVSFSYEVMFEKIRSSMLYSFLKDDLLLIS